MLPGEFENEAGDAHFLEYYENNLLANKQDAEKIVIYTVAYVLRANILVIMLDLKQDAVETVDFCSKFSNNQTIRVIFRAAHYDLGYSAENFQILNTIASKISGYITESSKNQSLLSNVFDLMRIQERNAIFEATNIKEEECFVCCKEKRTGEMAFCYTCIYKSFVDMIYRLYIEGLKTNNKTFIKGDDYKLTEELSCFLTSLPAESRYS